MKLTKNSIKDGDMKNIKNKKQFGHLLSNEKQLGHLLSNEKQLGHLLSSETIKDYSEINSEDAFNCNKEYSKQVPGTQVRQKMLKSIFSLFKKPCPQIQISNISNLKHKVSSSF